MVAAVGYEITTRELRINCTGTKVIGYTVTIEKVRAKIFKIHYSAHKLNFNMTEARLLPELQETKAEFTILHLGPSLRKRSAEFPLPIMAS